MGTCLDDIHALRVEPKGVTSLSLSLSLYSLPSLPHSARTTALEVGMALSRLLLELDQLGLLLGDDLGSGA